MKSNTYTLLLVVASTLALGLVNPTGATAAPKGPGFEPMVEYIDYTEGDQIPVGHTRVEVPKRYAEGAEKGLEAMPSYAGKDVTLTFYCPDGYTVGRTKRAGEPWTAATTSSGYARSEWTFKKGALVCTQPASMKKAFPSWFPEANPTVADIRRLGELWGPSTPVAVGLQIPMPDLSTCVPARLPDGRLTELRSVTPFTADWADGIEGYADATWEMSGGSGLMYRGSGHIGNPVVRNAPNYQYVGYYTLSPDTPLVISDPKSTLYDAGSVYDTAQKRRYDAWYVGWDVSGGVVPDCGQANLPQSLIAMWNIPRIAWTDRNGWHADEYLTVTERTLGPKDLSASPLDRGSNPPWTSSPGTNDN